MKSLLKNRKGWVVALPFTVAVILAVGIGLLPPILGLGIGGGIFTGIKNITSSPINLFLVVFGVVFALVFIKKMFK